MSLYLVFEHVHQDLASYLEKCPPPGLGQDRIKVCIQQKIFLGTQLFQNVRNFTKIYYLCNGTIGFRVEEKLFRIKLRLNFPMDNFIVKLNEYLDLKLYVNFIIRLCMYVYMYLLRTLKYNLRKLNSTLGCISW